MNWEHLRFDWTKARAFLATAELGSLSAAARALGQSQPTLGRQVEALETDLGVVLFERIGKRLVLTPGGLELLVHVREMGEAAQRVALTATGQIQALEGTITISAGSAICAHVLPPALARLRAEHPGIDIRLLATGQISDLQMREADLAIRNVRPSQSDLVAKRGADAEAGLYATPAYLNKLGGVETAAELQRAEMIGFDDRKGMIDVMETMGISLTDANLPIVSEAHLVQWELVRRGLGVGVMMCVVAEADPTVTRVLPDLFAYQIPMWLVAHREVNTSRRVRVVFDMLADLLG